MLWIDTLLAPMTAATQRPPATARLLARLKAIPEGEVAATARRAGLAHRHLSRLRAGGNLDVQLSTLEKLAQGLGTSIGAMLGEGEPGEPVSPEPRRPEIKVLRRLLRRLGDVAEDARFVAAALPEDPAGPEDRGRRPRRSRPA